MVQYNPKDWITYIFKFHKSDTFRQLIPMMLLIGAYSASVCYLEIHFFKLKDDSHVKNISIMHTTVGFVLSLLLAYRTNTAYDRWWEGRKLWGSLVNNSRNLAIKLSAILENESDKNYFRKIIPGYASILAKHLTNEEVGKVLFEGFYVKNNDDGKLCLFHQDYEWDIATIEPNFAWGRTNEFTIEDIVIHNPKLSLFVLNENSISRLLQACC